MLNPFFKNNGPFKISELLKTIDLEDNKIQTDTEISDIKDLNSSDRNQITFYAETYADWAFLDPIAKNLKRAPHFCQKSCQSILLGKK